jgi:hypothetical protein
MENTFLTISVSAECVDANSHTAAGISEEA